MIIEREDIELRYHGLDVVGDLPVILVVLDDSQNVLKKYIYGNSQILAQHDTDDLLYFYLHDRLGSVRQIRRYVQRVPLSQQKKHDLVFLAC